MQTAVRAVAAPTLTYVSDDSAHFTCKLVSIPDLFWRDRDDYEGLKWTRATHQVIASDQIEPQIRNMTFCPFFLKAALGAACLGGLQEQADGYTLRLDG